jgi:hypothetical protein
MLVLRPGPGSDANPIRPTTGSKRGSHDPPLKKEPRIGARRRHRFLGRDRAGQWWRGCRRGEGSRLGWRDLSFRLRTREGTAVTDRPFLMAPEKSALLYHLHWFPVLVRLGLASVPVATSNLLPWIQHGNALLKRIA